jgi:sugar phosphate isomerase/epimerase
VSVFDTNNIRRLISAAHEMTAPSFRVWLPGYDDKGGYRKIQGRVRKQLEKLSKLLKKSKVKLLIEIHHGTLVPSANAGLSLLNGLSHKSFGIIYDPGNMIIEGREKWSMGLDLLGPYLAYIHVKNTGWIKVKGKWENRWLPLEKGMVDWTEVMTALVARSYKGFLSIENLFQVPLKTKGLAKESLRQSKKSRSWKKRIEDIKYLKKLEKSVKKGAFK